VDRLLEELEQVTTMGTIRTPMTPTDNPLGLRGIAFVAWASPRPAELDALFTGFGFSRVAQHRELQVDLYRQNDILFLLDQQPGGQALAFAAEHGPSIPAMGWWVDDAQAALEAAVARGARAFTGNGTLAQVPALYGIGDSILYLVDGKGADAPWLGQFVPHDAPREVADKGFLAIDHLTNNVPKGGLATWSDFYKAIFGFTEVRYFDIKGAKTGLVSYALRSPDGSFSIPINEGNEAKSQIEEYLREYKGPGVQHLAFLTRDLLASLDALEGSGIATLDIDDDYYATVYDRVPNVTEDRARIKHHQVLVDGDEEGYLLQVFTKNVVGPIFVEMIQRKNHLSFGEGNFGALFRSIERDQERRGVL